MHNVRAILNSTKQILRGTCLPEDAIITINLPISEDVKRKEDMKLRKYTTTSDHEERDVKQIN